ncbi:hypothetical protein [Cohnella sp.]|uniref:hypothetical protein n=1 Tax=Cohnella sp. TaxID=1883426 RepID=UPI00370471C6
MITNMLAGYDAVRATKDLEKELEREIRGIIALVLQTAKSNIRYYPDVRNHLEAQLFVVANQMIQGQVTADYWQAWLEQFGKGSKMADSAQNPGLLRYMSSEAWNRLRSRSSRAVVGRPAGRYRGIDGITRESKGGYAGVDLEELAARGDIDPSFGPTPPTFFLRIALQANKNRILQGLVRVIEEFPYHKYFIRR